MTPLYKRLSMLESRTGKTTGRWHRIIQEVGQTFQDARSAYEACNGTIAETDDLIVRRIVTP